MRFFILAVLWFSFAVLAGEAKTVPPDDPFAEVKQEQKSENFTLDDEDKKIIAKTVKEEKYGRLTLETKREFNERMDAFITRWSAGAKTWTPADFASRIQAMQEFSELSALRGFATINKAYPAVVDYVSRKDDDPNGFIERIMQADRFASVVRCSNTVDFRNIVLVFFEQEKYAKATTKQKYQFVTANLLTKVKNAEARRALEGLAQDFKSDTDEEKTPQKKTDNRGR